MVAIIFHPCQKQNNSPASETTLSESEQIIKPLLNQPITNHTAVWKANEAKGFCILQQT